jgi:hypothetical protein
MVINRLGRCLLLPPAPFSRCGFPLSFLLLLMLLLAASCKSVLCPSVSLVGGELEEASGLAIVLRQAAPAMRVEEPEIVLRPGGSLHRAGAAAGEMRCA